MKKHRTAAILGITVALSAAAILLFGSRTAFSTSPLLAFGASTSTPKPPAGEPIPLKLLTDLSSLSATAKISANGLINGEKALGDLNAEILTNDKGQSKITVTGSLLGTIAAQVGGSVVGLFKPSSVDIYQMPTGSYIVVNSLVTVCVKPSDPASTAALREFSPQELMSMLTRKEVAKGKLTGQEEYNGATLNRYILNGDAFLAASKKSGDPALKSFGDALWDAGDADLWVDAGSRYPVAYRNSFSGEFEPLKFEGNFDVSVQLTGVNTNPAITLPASCKNPITP